MKKLTKALLGGGSILAGAFLSERILAQRDVNECVPYGTRIDTPYGKMNVSIEGCGEPVIVLLSGYGTAAPLLDFAPLAKRLSAFAQVVSVEYLGYGYSDEATRPRTTANICEELHALLSVLEYKKYYLMAHSISGVYALYYLHQYPNEVCGIINIDSSVPKQIQYVDASKEQWLSAPLKKSGLMRLWESIRPGQFLPNSPEYDAQALATIKGMMFDQRRHKSIADEGKRIKANFLSAVELEYPDDVSILTLLSSRNCGAVAWWRPLHEEQLRNHPHSQLVELKGSHYLHWTNSAEIAKVVHAFLQEAKHVK
ncbi:MAG: alpha/beta hydrolase [Erysipelotrichaceae bacterium]|nr:alpha/beta hydrolase [Erysipelotrichaceae bacterium]